MEIRISIEDKDIEKLQKLGYVDADLSLDEIQAEDLTNALHGMIEDMPLEEVKEVKEQSAWLTIVPTNFEESDYRYALMIHDNESDKYTYYLDSNGDIVESDSVFDIVNYCKSLSLEIEDGKEQIEEYIESDLHALGDTAELFTINTINDIINRVDREPNETLHDYYSRTIEKLYTELNDNRTSIEEEISETWEGNRDYETVPKEYFDITVTIAKQLIQYNFEKQFSHGIAERYLEEYGESTGKYYEIVEDNYEVEDGLMLILYDISPKEVAELKAQNKDITDIVVNEDHFVVDLNDLHNVIPKEFFDKLYDVPFDRTKEIEKDELLK